MNDLKNKIETDLFKYRTIAKEIIEFTNATPEIVWENIGGELDEVGYNMAREAKKYKIEKFVFNEEMIELYNKSDAFIYESSIESARPARRAKWAKIIDVLLQLTKDKDRSKVDILVYGDSVGNDSIYLKKLGFTVYYFDFDSYCAKFASYRFAKRKLDVTRLDNIKSIDIKFDFIICIEVAEHAPDPKEIIKEISSLIKSDGICVFSEGFKLLTDSFPTHLESNRRYIGKTKKMFREEKFYLISQDIDEKPFYFSKNYFNIFSFVFLRVKLVFVANKVFKMIGLK